jgi:translation initiation factor IF-1
MKKSFALILLASVAFTSSVVAQKKGDDKYTHYFKDVEEALESKKITVELTNGVSRKDFLKFKAKYTNNTNDFIIVDPSKTKITLGAVDVFPKEKTFILDPNDKNSKTIDLKEGADFMVESFEVAPEGFAVIPLDGTPVSMPEFQLPASVNNIESGNFEVNLKRVTQETKQTWAVFSIKYTGNEYAIIDPSRISVKTEAGDQFANEFRKSKTILLEKGDSKNVDAVFHIPAKVVDMQFAKLFIQWGECMVETKAEPFELDETATFELDEALTADKNK